ncbi:MAG: PQQ-binding-like beta-propeller repeat protein, partial [Pirellulaceae bacterium]|nr:PQQ-binding-like beta-propeller repeat protein [Pirellulaceae bacterium]
FVPMTNGQILAYPIEKKRFEEDEDMLPTPPPAVVKEDAPEEDPEAEAAKSPMSKPAAETISGPLSLEPYSDPPLTCVSLGRVTSQPIFIHEDNRNQYLAWSTSTGLFVGFINLTMQEEFVVKYQLRTSSPMVTQPTYLPPGIGQGNTDGLVFTTSAAGEIHAVAATRGSEVWQYAVGQPINEPVIPIRDRLYAVTELGTLFCLESVTGKEVWSIEGVGQFVAAGKDRVYVADRHGQLLMLDANTGARVDSLFTSDLPLKFRNVRTDRIFLATPSGLIQCLREAAQTEPLRHRKVVEADTEKPPQPGAKPKPKDDKDPFAVPDQEAEKDPFAAPAEGKEEDPFAAPAQGGANPFD